MAGRLQRSITSTTGAVGLKNKKLFGPADYWDIKGTDITPQGLGGNKPGT
jgi:hypothetical protein